MDRGQKLKRRKPKFTLMSGDNPLEPEWTPSPVKVSLWNTRSQKMLSFLRRMFRIRLRRSPWASIVRISPYPLCTYYLNITSKNLKSLSLTSSPFRNLKLKNIEIKSGSTSNRSTDHGKLPLSLQATTAASIAIIKNSVSSTLG